MKNSLLILCALIGITVSIYLFSLKEISFQLFIYGLIFFGYGMVVLIIKNIQYKKFLSLSFAFVLGILSLWMVVDVNPKELLFGTSSFSYWLHQIIFGLGFVFFGILGGVALLFELKNLCKLK